MTSTSFRRCAVISIVIMLGSVAIVTPLMVAHASSHHQTCKPPYTKLYIYTYPVQSSCVLLKHTGIEQNKSNMEYNAGVVAGQKVKMSQGVNFTSWKCPASHTKSFVKGGTVEV